MSLLKKISIASTLMTTSIFNTPIYIIRIKYQYDTTTLIVLENGPETISRPGICESVAV